MSRWVFPKRLAGKRLKTWKELFGKNEWRITSTRIHGNFEGHKSVATYRILWADEWSAVLLVRSESSEYPQLFRNRPADTVLTQGALSER